MPKVNIHTPAGLDAFVDGLTGGPPVILADMGAGSGQVTYDWLDKMYPRREQGRNCLHGNWRGYVRSGQRGERAGLGNPPTKANRVPIVENQIFQQADFLYWRESEQAEQFQRMFAPSVIRMDYRLPELEMRYATMA